MNMAINSMLGSSISTYNQLRGLSRKDVQGYIDEYKKAQQQPVDEAPVSSAKPEATAPEAPREINFQDLMESMTASGRGSFARSMTRLGGMADLAGGFTGISNGVFGSSYAQPANSMFGSSPATGVYSAMATKASTNNYSAGLYQSVKDYSSANNYQSGGSGLQGMFNQLLNVYA